MPLLFSYGTLRDAEVQSKLFGRVLVGQADQLVGFVQTLTSIHDPAFVAQSGKSEHAIVRRTGKLEDRISGTVFEVSEQELSQADAYEPDAYARILGRLASGRDAWVYADVTAPEL